MTTTRGRESMRDSEWYDEFWTQCRLEVNEDEGTSAIRLLGELYADGVIDRDGDYLVGNDPENPEQSRTYLNTSDQYIVRCIFDAVDGIELE